MYNFSSSTNTNIETTSNSNKDLIIEKQISKVEIRKKFQNLMNKWKMSYLDKKAQKLGISNLHRNAKFENIQIEDYFKINKIKNIHLFGNKIIKSNINDVIIDTKYSHMYIIHKNKILKIKD